MNLHYYPGCTLKEKTVNLDVSTREAMQVLNVHLTEPKNWTCCGAEYPLINEKIAGLAPPVRILRQVEREGGDKVVTTCAFCYAVLKRANRDMLDNPERHKRINQYLKDDIEIDQQSKTKTTGFKSYDGDVSVLHLVEYIKEYTGFANLKKYVKKDMSKLKVAAYYGCRLLRPEKEVAIDDPEDPVIFEDFLKGLGCGVIDYPFKQECCGSYISLSMPDAASELSYNIIESARINGADLLVLSCPLCYYNMDSRQDRIKEKFMDFNGFPVLFFTQLMAWAFGVPQEKLGFDQHFYNPLNVLRAAENAEVAS